jgi:hypothetical protein
MRFGFPAKYQIVVNVGLQEKFLTDVVRQTLSELGWEYWVADRLTDETPSVNSFLAIEYWWFWDFWSTSRRLQIDILSGGRLVLEASSLDQFELFDWGANRRIVDKFMRRFRTVLTRPPPPETTSPELDEIRFRKPQ